eukprot:CAMPEP_0206427774 /NCGR_PEP_ID=MMETSP0324_2-20121206/5246_1 /ASSEMBLY_ACC=CAM_ASM_000836 /TAXON_ID=2866 /ORGANISM="Crypthecodinium cohnii, Strain Seligo" /LENGTH=128 /DNA_ID=CAMNT_0053893129 /DNA_START=424 /DNA_END=810 /DNA_ORIENTATION=+
MAVIGVLQQGHSRGATLAFLTSKAGEGGDGGCCGPVLGGGAKTSELQLSGRPTVSRPERFSSKLESMLLAADSSLCLSGSPNISDRGVASRAAGVEAAVEAIDREVGASRVASSSMVGVGLIAFMKQS